MRRTLLFVGLVLVLLVFPLAACAKPAPTPAPAPVPKVTRILQGVSCGVTSSAFPVYARYAELGNKYVENLEVTLLNLGGSVSATNALIEKKVDVCTSLSGVMYEASHATGKAWKDKTPYKKFRLFAITCPFFEIACVREGSGITSLEGLDGKKFSAGTPGGGTETNTWQSFDALGIEPDYFVGSLQDATVAMKDGRIVGLMKACIGESIDAVHIDIMSTTPIRWLFYTEEQAKTIKEQYPWINFSEMPKGYWKQLPDLGPGIGLTSWMMGPLSRDDFPEDIAYNWTKALHQHWDEVAAVNPQSFAKVDLLKTPAITEKLGFYLHPGAIKYYREQGVQIPDSIIPPEMK